MTAEAEAAHEQQSAPQHWTNVTCPFCGLHCDDLEIGRSGTALAVQKNACEKARAGFERQLPPASPAIEGRKVALAEAVGAAAALIGKAALPLFGGLATDVDGMRAVMSLADRAGGVVDHALSDAQYRNFRVLQTSGWITSTLNEVRNRADLLVIVGRNIGELHPRFVERIARPAEVMFDTAQARRQIILLGEDTGAAFPGADGEEVSKLTCPSEQIGDVLAALRARLRGASLAADSIGGLKLADIDGLIARCRAAKYGVMVWAPPAFDGPHADLLVHLVSEIVKDLNQTTRFAGLSLGGNEGSVTAAAVCGWQTGYPLRTSFASGSPQFDPVRYSSGRLLASGECDLLLWLASFSPALGPPQTSIPTIVLGTPGLIMPQTPAVFIPVGTPGLDHGGSIVRCDNVVSLPLRNLERSSLPRAADVLAAIEAAL